MLFFLISSIKMSTEYNSGKENMAENPYLDSMSLPSAIYKSTSFTFLSEFHSWLAKATSCSVGFLKFLSQTHSSLQGGLYRNTST